VIVNGRRVVAALNINNGTTVNNPAETRANEKPMLCPNYAFLVEIKYIKYAKFGINATKVSIDKVCNAPAFRCFFIKLYEPQLTAKPIAIQGNLPYATVKIKTPIVARITEIN